MNCAIGSAVTGQGSHADGIRIVVFQPLFAAERIADRRLQPARQLDPPHCGHLCSHRPRRIATVFAPSIILQVGSGRLRKGEGWVDQGS